jgi:hypothetical protein
MRWSEALERVRRPDITNRDAAGLIVFVRKAHRRYAGKYGLAPFDWLGFALPVLGWTRQGDRLVVTKRQQGAPYELADALWTAIDDLAVELDDAGQPFELVSMLPGTAAHVRELAEAVAREIAGPGGVMGAISAADARKKVDTAKDTALTNAKRSGAAFVFAQATADGAVFTDEFPDIDAAKAALDRATDDDQVLAAGVWNVATRKLVEQKAGALEVTADKSPASPAPVEPSPPKKQPGGGLGGIFPWLLLAALVDASTKQQRIARRVW